MTRNAAATRLGLGVLMAVVLSHGLYLAMSSPALTAIPAVHSRLWERLIAALNAAGIGLDDARMILGGVAALVVLACQAALARGVEGLHPALLLAPLFTALSPLFAETAMTSGEEVLFAALLLAGCARAFAETHTAGRLPASAVLFGASAGLGWGGLVALGAAFAHRILFARRFRLPAPVYRFAIVWLAIGLFTFGMLRWLIGPWEGGPISAQPLVRAVESADFGFAARSWLLVSRLWDEVNGLALLPFVLVLFTGWKPKALYFVLTLAGLLLLAWLAVAVWAPPAAAGRMLAPAIPLAAFIIGEALRGVAPALESVGLKGRARTTLIAVVIGALALGQAWPTLARIAAR